jgi:hypothetical protein
MRWTQVDYTVTCQGCGAPDLAWLKSKNDKWYLAQTRRSAGGRIEAGVSAFHDCPNRAGRGRARYQAWSPAPPPPKEIPFDPMLEEILKSGYKAIARKVHPDVGGSTEQMQKLNGMMTALRDILRCVMDRGTN